MATLEEYEAFLRNGNFHSDYLNDFLEIKEEFEKSREKEKNDFAKLVKDYREVVKMFKHHSKIKNKEGIAHFERLVNLKQSLIDDYLNKKFG